MQCHHPKCKMDHLADPILAYIHKLPAYELVTQYADALEEILTSMRDDIKHDRRAAYLTRLRDYLECYFKALWTGLLATPDEIIHDASCQAPYLMLSELAKKVCKEVLEEDSKLSQAFLSPENVQFKPIHLLNATTHMTALYLTYYKTLDEASIQNMYSGNDRSAQFQVAALRYVAGMLKAGKPRSITIQGVRQISRK
jgi:hypothetical protein